VSLASEPWQKLLQAAVKSNYIDSASYDSSFRTPLLETFSVSLARYDK